MITVKNILDEFGEVIRARHRFSSGILYEDRVECRGFSEFVND